MSCGCVLSLFYVFCSLRSLPPLRSTLFPYTTLFRSRREGLCPRGARRQVAAPCGDGPGTRVGAVAAGSCNLTRSEEHTSELQSLRHLVCRLLLEKKKKQRERIVV